MSKFSINSLQLMLLMVPFMLSACFQRRSLGELNTRAHIFHKQGEYSKAARAAKKALKIGERDYGTNHPDVALLMINLGGIYNSQGKFEKAESFYQKALSLTTKVLGQDHPDVAAMSEDMAEFYRKAGKEIEANKYMNRAKELRLRYQP